LSEACLRVLLLKLSVNKLCEELPDCAVVEKISVILKEDFGLTRKGLAGSLPGINDESHQLLL